MTALFKIFISRASNIRGLKIKPIAKARQHSGAQLRGVHGGLPPPVEGGKNLRNPELFKNLKRNMPPQYFFLIKPTLSVSLDSFYIPPFVKKMPPNSDFLNVTHSYSNCPTRLKFAPLFNIVTLVFFKNAIKYF